VTTHAQALARLEDAHLAALTARAGTAALSEAATAYCAVALECLRRARVAVEFEAGCASRAAAQRAAA
jgi:hypothetical protein